MSAIEQAVSLAETLSPDDRFRLIVAICETFNNDAAVADLDDRRTDLLDDALGTIVKAAEDVPDLSSVHDPDARFWNEADYRYGLNRDALLSQKEAA